MKSETSKPASTGKLRRAGWLILLGIGFLVLSWLVLHPPLGSPVLAAAPNELPAQIEDTETSYRHLHRNPHGHRNRDAHTHLHRDPHAHHDVYRNQHAHPHRHRHPADIHPNLHLDFDSHPNRHRHTADTHRHGHAHTQCQFQLIGQPQRGARRWAFHLQHHHHQQRHGTRFQYPGHGYFSSFLDISGATSTKGTVATNPAARTVNVTIGTINPNETVTILIIMTVNNGATATTTQAHNSVMIFTYSGITQSKASNAVAYRIVVGSTLPPTGGMEQAAPGQSNDLYLPAIGIGFILFSIGLLALIMGGRMRAKGSTWSGWLTRTGLVVLVAGMLFTLGGLALSGALKRTPPLNSRLSRSYNAYRRNHQLFADPRSPDHSLAG